MHNGKSRILLHAEPFGFGPAAAIAQIAALLAKRHVSVGYIGEGHTHDLQQDLGYQDRYDLSNLNDVGWKRIWRQTAQKYGIFMTAMDFQAAEEARRVGMQVVIYDALAWYWPTMPEIAKAADLYIAQDFFGVRERVAAQVSPYTKTEVVPPLVMPHQSSVRRSGILLNLGGLQNPYWERRDAASYAQAMVKAVRLALPDEDIQIATSRAVAQALHDPAIQTYGPTEMQSILSSTSLAVMTPGLGNMYDAAAYNVPTVWLPPANDSQGRQLTLLQQHGYCDAALTWDVLGARVDVMLPQKEVLRDITNIVRRLQTDQLLAGHLQEAMRRAIGRLAGQTSSKTTALLQKFGSGGAVRIADHLMSFAKRDAHAGS